ncbi:MAG: hypothetical protein CMA10_04680 [Euryarchaeota archaeon]|nr:hypothetical protein [Euryarchaeota archaeon]
MNLNETSLEKMASPNSPFLGATTNHHPIALRCNDCGHIGFSLVTKKWGVTAYLCALLTFGVTAWCAPKDTYHWCSCCGAKLGVAKIM